MDLAEITDYSILFLETMIEHLDYLIMLLSTDWFRPYWDRIGLSVGEPAASSIQDGRKQIVKQLISEAETYYSVSFTDERRLATRRMLVSLATGLRVADQVRGTILEWQHISGEDITAAWACMRVTRRLLSEQDNTSALLDSEINEALTAAWQQSNSEDEPFEEMCLNSQTRWDVYTRNLTPDQPTFLADHLMGVSRARAFRSLWDSVATYLPLDRLKLLVAWYLGAQGRKAVLPSYISAFM